ncbi:oligoendopeptidase F, partial [Alkalihalophilus pseudofirmus]|nr:oligoendopeptidase F [Alkalihalophilus pseudofirmus]
RLEDIFATDEEWEKEYQEVKGLIPAIKEFEGKLSESADTLYKALQFEDQLLERIGKLYTYSHMRYDQDSTNSFYQGLDDRMKNLYSQAASALA